MAEFKKNDDVSIVLCGEAGQGIQTVERLLTRVLKFSGFNVFATKEYMSRVRGGMNSTEIRVSSKKTASFVDRVDILIPLNRGAVAHLGKRVKEGTLILGEKENVGDHDAVEVPFTEIAAEVGNKIYSNVVAVGTISSILGIDFEFLKGYLERRFSEKGEKIAGENIQAALKGYKIGEDLVENGTVKIEIKKNDDVRKEYLFNGSEAVSMGAMAGGCNFISSYPMSPSTGVLTFLSSHAKKFGMVAEQAEDEISAVNMALGAWYAGARAMVTTSGGGFALMTEGVSLAGMIESPIVIHIAQRPGPATGLPTRTEQGDLNLALYAGHGEFPRVIFAPGNLEKGFSLAQRAFHIADKYQVPVFILTDQYYVDSYYNIPEFKAFEERKPERFFVKTDSDYKRYRLTENGLSPRGIPGYGEGLVNVDSDEHDEEGHITEDLDLRVRMVDKRLKKIELLLDETLEPELYGNEEYGILVVGWGSTYHAIREAIEFTGRKDISLLHFNQVYPIHKKVGEYLQRADKTVIIENNSTSQFGRLIKLETGVDFDEKILKYNGMPFSVEEIAEKLKKL